MGALAVKDRRKAALCFFRCAIEPLKGQEWAQLQKELERWGELKQEDRSRIEDRLKTLPPSEDREQLFKEYGRQLLGIKN
jgi:hypothetical protein